MNDDRAQNPAASLTCSGEVVVGTEDEAKI